MSIFKEVVKEEIERQEKKILFYSNESQKLNPGTLFIRKIGGNSYAYSKRKINGKVISKYLGSINDKETIKRIEEIKEYKRLKSNLMEAKKELSILKRTLRLYEKTNWTTPTNFWCFRR